MKVIPNIVNTKTQLLKHILNKSFLWLVPITEIDCNIVSSANMPGIVRKTNSSYNKHFYLKTEKEESLMFYDLKLSSCKKYKLQQQYNTTIQFYNTKYGANIDKHNPYCLISIPNLINWTAASRGKGKLFFANFLKIL